MARRRRRRERGRSRMKRRDLRYIRGRDKLIGFFWPSYLERRREHVEDRINEDGVVKTSEKHRRLGLFNEDVDQWYKFAFANMRNF